MYQLKPQEIVVLATKPSIMSSQNKDSFVDFYHRKLIASNQEKNNYNAKGTL